MCRSPSGDVVPALLRFCISAARDDGRGAHRRRRMLFALPEMMAGIENEAADLTKDQVEILRSVVEEEFQ